ncbi:MAG: LLM class flavin-dependent oxidoreductase [Pseudonocardiaceae bacterium]|nr:LLM class flavin-dependent oxidoreductase [Pseudonocardiaceae bacterium]
MEISCSFPPSPQTPDHIVLAEQLGYERAWVYDSPVTALDSLATLALAAYRTDRIGLATGVLVPSLRHPVSAASAIATVEQLAPGRVVVGIGAGGSSRWPLGERAMRWSDVETYAVALRGLLCGEKVEWQGKVLAMCHPAGFAPARPITVPIVIGAEGPKGFAVASRVADGVATFVSTAPKEFDWIVRVVFGTVLEEGEPPTSERVYEVAGPAAALAYHAGYEWYGAAGVKKLPGGEAWLDAVEQVPERERHLAIHAGHAVVVNDIDRTVMPSEMVGGATFTGTPEELRKRIVALEADGVTELNYQPNGADIPRELEAFAEVASCAHV